MEAHSNVSKKEGQSRLIFDQAGLTKRLSGNISLAEKLVQQFLADTSSQLCLLKKMLEEGDGPSARRRLTVERSGRKFAS